MTCELLTVGGVESAESSFEIAELCDVAGTGDKCPFMMCDGSDDASRFACPDPEAPEPPCYK